MQASKEWCIVRAFMHIAGQLLYFHLHGGSKMETTLKTVAKNDNRFLDEEGDSGEDDQRAVRRDSLRK